VVQVLIGGVGLEDIFPETVALIDVEIVVVVDGCGAEVVLWGLLLARVLGDVLEDELA
jgi:hypothetical protein